MGKLLMRSLAVIFLVVAAGFYAVYSVTTTYESIASRMKGKKLTAVKVNGCRMPCMCRVDTIPPRLRH
jgi:hypothetical protein